MPESDVSKMKVADLKRELKLRGLLTTGNKNELQDRLQTALIDGELSLEDTAISGEDLLDEEVLTDEDESKILGADENELLKSPTTTPTAGSDFTKPLQLTADDEDVDEDAVLQSPTTPSKKVVLKRKNSFTTTSTAVKETVDAGAATGLTSKENAEPLPAKTVKMSERNPITIDGSSAASSPQTKAAADTAAAGAATKVSQLSLQERLEMRAKKFGTSAQASSTTAGEGTAAAGSSIVAAATDAAGGDEKQIEMLKKRAERFGCVVSSKIAKLDAEEKLLKRKQRFGGGVAASDADTTTTTTSTSPGNDVWAEKARLRLKRFETTAAEAPAAGAVSTKTPVEAPTANNPPPAADAAN